MKVSCYNTPIEILIFTRKSNNGDFWTLFTSVADMKGSRHHSHSKKPTLSIRDFSKSSRNLKDHCNDTVLFLNLSHRAFENEFLIKFTFLSQTSTTFLGTLASFRINRIFGYWEQITDQKFRQIVRKYQHRLITDVQKTLAERNAQRKAKNQLGYQYLEPRWLTNSIHI